jgi:anaerobic selenocysteine-containing dehydrogenase
VWIATSAIGRKQVSGLWFMVSGSQLPTRNQKTRNQKPEFMKRREFIILSGIGATSASLLSACGHPEEKLIPAFIPDDEFVPGIDYWKASTCGMCPAGCGILVRTREHKANKIEGNPLHPVNRGALCARGQAGLEVLYNPDRIKGPMKRVGERGEGKWQEITWDEGIKSLADKLREIRENNTIAYVTNDPFGVNGSIASQFRVANGFPDLYTSYPYRVEGDTIFAYSVSFGAVGVPTFDIANATYLLSFGARFLETWLSPVMYSLAYGEFRKATGKTRGRFVHVEPRLSLTAASADEWLPAAAGSEELVALAVAQVIVREGLQKSDVKLGYEAQLEAYAPEHTQQLTDISPEKIIRIAREFASSERPIAVAGAAFNSGAAAPQVLRANLLYALLGYLNKAGGVLLPRYDPFEPFLKKDDYAYRPISVLGSEGTISALMVDQVNFSHIAPQLLEKIKSIPFIASFSPSMDETTEQADLILPGHSYLESWNVHATASIRQSLVASITAPAIKPEYNTKQTAEALLELSKELGKPLPFNSTEEFARDAATKLMKRRGSIDTADENEFWTALVERGVWEAPSESNPGTDPREAATYKAVREASAGLEALKKYHETAKEQSDGSEYPYALLAYEHSTLAFGEHANLPSLQELPDPMVSVMWGSWIEINPKTAKAIGIADGDMVEVISPDGSVVAPAVIYPGIRPDAVALPYGQGHTASGRYARNRGANGLLVSPLSPFGQDANPTQQMIRVKVIKVSIEGKLIRFGTDLQEQMEKKR